MAVPYLETMVRLAAEIADAHGASLFLREGSVLRPYIIYNLPEEYVAGIGTVRVGTQCCGRAVESKAPWIVTDMLEDPLFAEGRDGARNSLIRAAFSVPVLQENEAVASLACHYTAPHTPSALDIERNQHFARLIAITLKGAGVISLTDPVFTWPLGQELDRSAVRVEAG
ncbi:MAG TPA: GAF domain-containing protein [Steroidobacteraceae bacterium]|nr:GAF domain-containing protein [Steroidobacteraceae bacterium]